MGFNLGGLISGGLTGFLTGGPAGAAAGAVGGALAKGPGKPKSVGNRYFDQAFSKAMKLYDETDVAANDEAALAEYEKAASGKGIQLLEDYDALAAGAGSPIGKADTSKDLARAGIAKTVSRDVAGKRAELMLTRASRKMALLPGLNQPSSLGVTRDPGNIDSLMTLGKADWGSIFKKRGGTTYGSGSDTATDR